MIQLRNVDQQNAHFSN